MKQILAGLILVLLAGCATSPQQGEFRLRVMTYNIHHGEGTDGKVDLERIAKLITDNKVDLVALQEVDRNTQRTGKRDMPAELSRLTGMTNVFGANIDLEGGQYGNAILSRLPILSWTNHHLPKVVPGEQRGMLVATVNTKLGDLTFCSVHLDHRKPEEDRLAGVRRMQEILSQSESNVVVIAGDFNARPESRTYWEMSNSVPLQDVWPVVGRDEGFTIPSEKPSARIDYVWFRGRIVPSFAKVLKSTASDHCPLICDFVFDWGCYLPAMEFLESAEQRLTRFKREWH